MERYYELEADPEAGSRWFLDCPLDLSGREVDPDLFTVGRKYESMEVLRIPLQYEGDRVHFNFAAFDMVVIPKWLALAILPLVGEEVQCIPAVVEASDEEYVILNILETRSCINEERSEFMKWTTDDDRPDKMGHYKMVTELKIDPSKVSGTKMFRIIGWDIVIIAHQTIKDVFERNKVTGVSFRPVF